MKENERIEIWIGFLDYGWPIESFAKHVVRCVCMEKELNKKNRSELFAFITDAVGNVKRNQKYDIAIGAFFRLGYLSMYVCIMWCWH